MIKNKRTLFILIIVIVALTLGACTGQRVSATGWSGITLQEETVFFSHGSHAYAVNLKNGALQWQYPVETENGVEFYAAPVFADEDTQLIVGSYNGELYSLNPVNGMEFWSFAGAENRYIASPLATENGIFAASADNFLYALDFDGLLQWKFETGDPLWASPVWSESCGCIYQVSMDHILYAIDPESGKLLWKSEDLGGPIVSQPVISEDGLIILSTFNNEVIALDETRHSVEWRYQTSDWSWASPVIDGAQIYASDISGIFYALDLASGKLLWQLQPGGGIYSAPVVKDGMIYFSTDASSLVVVSQEGVVQRNQPIDGKLYASPTAAEGKLLLAPSEAEFFLVALNDSGVQIWGYPPAK
ncbi:MAG: PQQ-binding-like beta-propeller repeat protein [Anaerolineales bacterium]|nr:PQQ-binding-like beta-propeller repeat protein [Anaerolineales bacterium]